MAKDNSGILTRLPVLNASRENAKLAQASVEKSLDKCNGLRIIAFLTLVGSLTLLSVKTAAQTTAKASGVKEGVIKLADSNIEYFSRGEGETIVFLPGGTLTVGYLDGLAETLAKAGYRVVGINFRGSGKSTGPSDAVTLQTMADDVAGVIQALKLAPVNVAGNDFGNRVARM